MNFFQKLIYGFLFSPSRNRMAEMSARGCSIRGFLALSLSAALFAAVLFVANDAPVSSLQESFYELAENSLTSSQIDQMALSRSQELAQVPNQNSLLTDSLVSVHRGQTVLASKNAPAQVPDQSSLLTDSLVSVHHRQAALASKIAPATKQSLAQLDAVNSAPATEQSLAEQDEVKSDPSMAGYRNFNDLLKEAMEKEKKKRITFHEELNKMGRNSPEYLEKVTQREKESEANEMARKESDAGALKQLEDHMDRHIEGILALNEPRVKPTAAKNSEHTIEEYEKMERLRYEASVKSARLKRQQEMDEANQRAKVRVEQQLNDDVGNILSTVVPGEESSEKTQVSESAKKPQDSPASIGSKNAAGSSALIKEVKSYIDNEIAKEVHTTVPHSNQGDSAAKELAKLRAYILAGKFQQAVKLAGDKPAGDSSRVDEKQSPTASSD
jgi:hypothetical protein